jgi:hypothetical protein
LREAIEVYAVRDAVRTFTADELDLVERSLEAQQQATATQNWEEAHDLEERFHQLFIDRLNGKAPPPAPSRGTTPDAPKPGEVRVRVLNGNGADGAAAKVSESLQELGFNVADRGDADSFDYSRTVIRFAPAQVGKAQLLARHLQAGADLRPDSSLRTVDVALVVGADYTGVRSRPAPPPSAPGGATSPTTATTLQKLSPVPVPKGAPAQPSC